MRNFSRVLGTLHLSAVGRSATLRTQHAIDPDRVLTTAATLRGWNLFVDSKFDELVATGPYGVITDSVRR